MEAAPNLWTARLGYFQSVVYIATGIWPILHITSFITVTGPKVDLWLVQIVGALITTVGIGLLVASLRCEISMGIVLIASLAAFSLGTADVVFYLKGILLPVYLADAVLEFGLVLAWLAVTMKTKLISGRN